MYAVAVSYNNKHDLRADTINRRTDNPLIGHKISDRELNTFLVICISSLVALQFLIHQPASVIISISYLVLSLSYSYPKLNLKSHGWAATILLSLCYGTLPLLLGFFQASTVSYSQVLVLAFLQAIIISPIILSKDYKDLRGDKLTGKFTPLVIYGKATIVKVSLILSLISSVLIVAFAIRYKLNLSIILIMVTLYLFLVYKLHRQEGKLGRLVKAILAGVMLGISILLVKAHPL